MTSNMYKLSVKQWNPHPGCDFGCVYCKPSFQAQLKRWAGKMVDGGRRQCEKCYNYVPHEHPERLNEPLPKTGYMQFIFALANSDPAFCSTGYLEKIAERMRQEADKTFLMQSKEPKTFNRVKWPDNVILGTTVETNRSDLYLSAGISNAPVPEERVRQLADIDHALKMFTHEPILDFDLSPMIAYAETVRPCMIWMGYDSKNCGLPEPSLDKFIKLYWELGKRGFTVILKHVKGSTAIFGA